MTWFAEAAKTKHYSQSGEAGILDEMLKRVNVSIPLFLECGAGDGITLSNTRHLAERFCEGVWVESDPELFAKLFKNAINRVGAVNKAISCEPGHTLDDVCREQCGPDECIDLLSLDIDGNDYWVWKDLKSRPSVVCIEYNAGFPPEESRTIEYDPEFRFANTDYHGATAGALHKLGREKGYTLVAFCGVNMFFVVDELASEFGEVPLSDVPWRRSWRKDPTREMIEVAAGARRGVLYLEPKP
jgi:hypothetical protein